MAIDVSMYQAPQSANSLLQMLKLAEYGGNGGVNPVLSGLYAGGPSLARQNGGGAQSQAPMQANLTGDRQGTANAVADELRAAGVPENGIRGILANVQDESDFKPGLRHPDQPNFTGEASFAHGLYQEGGDEWNNYDAWRKQNAPDTGWDDPRLQTRFLAQNLQKNYPDVWKTLSTGSAEDSAKAFLGGYLKPRADFLASRSAKYSKGVPALTDYTGQPQTQADNGQ